MPCVRCNVETNNNGSEFIETVGGGVCDSCYTHYGTCVSCDGVLLSTTLVGSRDGSLCQTCRADYYTLCTDCGVLVHDDDIQWAETDGGGDAAVCTTCFSNGDYGYCSGCDTGILLVDGNQTTYDGSICNYCFENNYFTCVGCGNVYHSIRECCSNRRCIDCCGCEDETEELTNNEEGEIAMPGQGAQVHRSAYADAAPSMEEDIAVPQQTRGRRRVNPDDVRTIVNSIDADKLKLSTTSVRSVISKLGIGEHVNAEEMMKDYFIGNTVYYKISKIISEIGKITYPVYLYGKQNNKDVDIYIAVDDVSRPNKSSINSKLDELGLKVKYVRKLKDNTKAIGMSYKVRSKKYKKCISFLKWVGNNIEL